MTVDYKVVVVGNSSVGKSSLISLWRHAEIPVNYVPTIFDNYIVQYNNVSRSISIWDTAGDLNDLRNIIALSFSSCNLFVLCFDIGNPDSLNDIENNWIPFIQDYILHPKYILVGLKKELRTDQQTIQALSETGSHPVTYDEAVSKSRRIHAIKYCECSSLQNEGVTEFQNEVITYLINHSESRLEPITKMKKLTTKFRNKLGDKFFIKKRRQSDP